MRALRRHPITCYLAITFAVTWGAWLPLALTGRTVTIGFAPIYMLGLLGPLVGAIATSAIVAGTIGVRALVARMTRIRTGARWWGIGPGLLLAVALVLVLVNGFGEETGWRGYLLPHLQKRWSPLAASFLVGAVWAVWHVPAFFVSETYRQMPIAMVPVFVLGLMCGSVVLTWLYNRGRSSILLVAVWHGTYNWLSGSVGARGVFAAVETTAVMVIATILVIQEIVAVRHEHHGQSAQHAMAPRPMPLRPSVW